MLIIDPQTEYEQLRNAYDEAEALLAEPAEWLTLVVGTVSGWSPANHLYHLAVSNGRMLKAVMVLAQRGPDTAASDGLNSLGRRALERGSFPRGGQAPGSVQPPDTFTIEELKAAWVRSRNRFESVADVLPQVTHETSRIPHPYFGNLNAREWLRVTRLHARHHLAIIDSIRSHA